MAVGDRPPEWSYKTGTENGCTWRSDGHLYGANGRQVETNAEKKARREKEREIEEARRQNSGFSYGQIIDEGFQKMGSEITNTFHETNNHFVKGIIGAVGIGAVITGAAAYFSENKKDPTNKANAMGKAALKVLGVIGILVMIAVLCIMGAIAVFCIVAVKERYQAETKQLEQENNIEQIVDQSMTNNIQIDDKVIYEEEGVVATLENFEYDSRSNSYVCSVGVVNNNPDNQKVVFLQVEGVTLNGIDSAVSCPYMQEVLVGESKEMDITIFAQQYERDLNVLGEEINVLPIEKIGFYYRIQVGSDNDPLEGHMILKTPGYQEDNLNRVYGDRVYEFTVDETPFEVYFRKNVDGASVTLKNLGNSDMSFQGNLNFVDINGMYNSSVWVVNGKATNYVFPYELQTIRGEGGVIIFQLDTPENIRKDLEIPNDEPLDVSLQLSFGGFSTDAVIIPVSIE